MSSLLKSTLEEHMVRLKLARCGLPLTRRPARPRCLPSPVAKPLNIKNDVSRVLTPPLAC